jgi:hypothetical protein
MKKIILSAIFLFTLASVSMAQTEKAAPADNKNAPSMKFKEEEFNFGTIKQGDKVVHEFEFENSGKEPLMITEAHGSCGCTVPDYPKDPIKKGEKRIIKVTFDSAGKMGIQDKTVTITTNGSDSPKVLHLKGNVVQAASSTDSKPVEAPKN